MSSVTELEAHRDATTLLRRLLGPAGEDITALAVAQILEIILWDADLAATAILMAPRPAWVAEIVGPLVVPDTPPT